MSALEDHLGYWLRLVSNQVSFAFKTRVERRGVTVAEWVVLRELFDHAGVKASAVSEALGLSRGAVSKLLDRLAAKGLIGRRDDQADGRSQHVALSASGRRLVPQLAAEADENDAEFFRDLTAQQRSSLLAIMHVLVERHALTGSPMD